MDRLVVPVTGLFGVAFIVGGILGFMMGSPLIIFQVGTVQNIIHLASGLVALICAALSYNAAKWYLIVFGLLYGVVTVVGFVNDGNVLNIIQVNEADNYLHLGISVIALMLGLSSPAEE
jgi:hypothetical protein